MARLNVLGSGSKGNCYVVKCDKEDLIMELGVPAVDILKNLDYNLGRVSGVIVTHSHKDHFKDSTAKEFAKYGIGIWSTHEVAEKWDACNEIQPNKNCRIGGFTVYPLLVRHNAECYAYIIRHEEIGKLVFVTDAVYFPYRIKDVNHFVIEANYSADVVTDRLCNDDIIRSGYLNHMEFTNTLKTLNANFSSALRNIVLCHLSDGNADRKMFTETTKRKFGIGNVFIAENGLDINIDKDEF